MLVAGGVDDQPVGRWQASRKAGWIYQTCKTIQSTPSGKFPVLEDDQMKVYNEYMKIKMAAEEARNKRERGY